MRYAMVLFVALSLAPSATAQEIPHNFGDVTKGKLNQNFEFLLEEIKNLRQEIARLKASQTASLPIGAIIPWDPIVRDGRGKPTGDVRPLPTGWSICNGSKGTPSLADRFLMGGNSVVSAGQEGGSNTFEVKVSTGGAKGATKGARTDDLGNGSKDFPFTGHIHDATIKIDNRPSFYTVVFLCKTS